MTATSKEYEYGPSSPELNKGPHVGLETKEQPSDLEVYAVYNPHQVQEQWPYYSPTASYDKVPPPIEIFGLKRRTFWFLVILALVVVGAAVGGGVGGALAVQNSKKAEQRTTATLDSAFTIAPVTPTSVIISPGTTAVVTDTPPSATYTAPAAATLSLIPNRCPPPPGLIPSWDTSATFLCSNNTDIQMGDITGIVAYSLQSCIDACATMNKVQGKRTCIAISVGAELSQQYEVNKGANCWLKGNGTKSVRAGTFSGARLCEEDDGEGVGVGGCEVVAGAE